jgi:phage-related baseplate assembly protein
MSFTAIDLSLLPPPDFIEPLNFELIFTAIKQDAAQRDPDTLGNLLPSDPAYKVMECFAYRELHLRQRINEQARQCLLAYATGANLDHIGALYAVQRLVITPADETALPPIPAVLEDDTAFRARIQLAPEGFTNAGSRGAYRYHALSASAAIKDVGISNPNPGVVQVVVLANTANGTPTAGMLGSVSDALNADTVRPLNDIVNVVPCTPQNYSITATLTIADGPDASLVLEAAEAALAQYVLEARQVGGKAALSGIYNALHQPGVISVELTSPTADVQATLTKAPVCTSINVTAV